MGNNESTSGSHSSFMKRSGAKRRETSTSPVRRPEYRTRSESLAHPQSSRKLSSFRREDEEEPTIITVNKNRSKSFRCPSQVQGTRYFAGGRRKSDICETTGLSMHQKMIVTAKWRQLPQGFVFDLGKRIFETVFERDPYLLSIISLEHLQGSDEWRDHANFHLHAQRFSHVLSQCMRHLSEPIVAADRLQEFGAAYAEVEDSENFVRSRIPHSYWDRLITAITSTAKELHEDQPQQVRKNSLSVDDALLAKKDRLALETDSTNACAWNALATFVSNQIRFGYEMERMLRAELRKLAVNNARKAA
ncbi:hypothetical protein Tcan_09629 [Toxocara canis]|uniref:Globin domain-containing protein n=2 Tax=Toxocara canis TaxID=6265 RepID=A0A0B2V954_TOXCA|nr:hypothetical protein Tcan_09629 [Toxocara canis]VDM44838.1 unnamed protein product [Toxocara canis]